VPHEHFIKCCEGEGCERLKRVWLFVLAITIHNLPEGMATGVAAGAMLYVISEEIIPETHRVGREGSATAMLFGGFLATMYLDFALG
jgi:zinc transporter ZupT